MRISNRIFDPNAGGDVEANLQIAEDGLYVFGPNGKRLQFWRYDEIVNASAFAEDDDRVLVQRGRPEIRLTLADDSIYRTIAVQAPQLRRLPQRLLETIWRGVPEEIQVGLFLGAAVLAFLAYRAVAALFD